VTRSKLTKAEAGRLGGLTAAHKLGADGVAARARKGGDAASRKLGRAHYVRLALVRWGRLQAEKKEAARTTKRAAEEGVADAAGTPSPGS
jgi:hypothetical protein